MKLSGVIKKFIIQTADLFLPRFCPSCKSSLNFEDVIICKNCFSKIQIASKERIHREFKRKFQNKNTISDFFAPFVFEINKELQHAIHSLKYQNRYRVGIFLGKVLASGILLDRPDWKSELIIPVPLHKLKKAERGYNQSFYIAKGLSKILRTRYSDRILKRKKYTESQTMMTLTERQENISGAFSIRNKNEVRDKTILLIDDIITTGATISECGKVLLNAGAKKILAASIAIAD